VLSHMFVSEKGYIGYTQLAVFVYTIYIQYIQYHVCMEWNGKEWKGIEWNGMVWDGMVWNGMVCVCICNTYISYIYI